MNGLWLWFLRLPALDHTVMVIALVLSGVIVVLLLARRLPRWTVLAPVSVVIGGVVGALTLWIVEKPVDMFGSPLDWGTRGWVIACFAALGLAVANARRSSVRRKVGAAFGSVVFLATTALGINAVYGLDPTIGSMMGISTAEQLTLPAPVRPVLAVPAPGSATTVDPSLALWQTWKAPAGMPTKGTAGTAAIPGTVSGFSARSAGIYLPPAAQVPNPPALPLVVLLMGQPGNPDPQYIAAILDRYAAAHQGLAPIVVVADQLGDPTVDTLCLDTAKYGKVETYINTDVATWARTHLNIRPDRAGWTIAGYSHGGQCAISFAAKHPDLWGNVLDISGEEYPGAEHAATTLKEIFNGTQSAYDAQKPTVILSQHSYPDTTAIFTISTDDRGYMAGVKRVAKAAAAAGMHVTYQEVPNGGHVIGALNGGLEAGIAVLYPRLGLSQP